MENITDDFDGWTPDMKRAAAKREAAALASRGETPETVVDADAESKSARKQTTRKD